MDKQEIIEGNKLIAEFMGWTIEPGMEDDKDPYYNWNKGFSMALLSDLLFHEKWDWLMPVVEKIEDCFGGSIMVRIHDKRCHIEMGTQYGITKKGENIDVPDCYNGFCKTKIEATWKSVVKFIKWYNSQKQ